MESKDLLLETKENAASFLEIINGNSEAQELGKYGVEVGTCERSYIDELKNVIEEIEENGQKYRQDCLRKYFGWPTEIMVDFFINSQLKGSLELAQYLYDKLPICVLFGYEDLGYTNFDLYEIISEENEEIAKWAAETYLHMDSENQ